MIVIEGFDLFILIAATVGLVLFCGFSVWYHQVYNEEKEKGNDDEK